MADGYGKVVRLLNTVVELCPFFDAGLGNIAIE